MIMHRSNKRMDCMRRQSEMVKVTTPAGVVKVALRGYGNEARIDLKGNVNVLCGRYRYTFYETGFVAVTDGHNLL